MREPGLHVTPPVLWADSAARVAHERGTARGVRVIRLHGFLGRSLAACLSAEERGAERRPECGPVKPYPIKRGFRSRPHPAVCAEFSATETRGNNAHVCPGSAWSG